MLSLLFQVLFRRGYLPFASTLRVSFLEPRVASFLTPLFTAVMRRSVAELQHWGRGGGGGNVAVEACVMDQRTCVICQSNGMLV